MTHDGIHLPQLEGSLFLTDGGIETTLIFHHGLSLPCDAAYTLLENEAGIVELTRYYDSYLAIAAARGTGFILESPTWRANPDWAARIGTSPAGLEAVNRQAITMMSAMRTRYRNRISPIVISGCVGPRADAYHPAEIMTAEEAEQYHSIQIQAFSETEADMVTAITLTNIPEAIGIARAARRVGLPAVISFTVETDGRLPTGVSLQEAIEQVDIATVGSPAYYMINCAHPVHFESVLTPGADWIERIRGLRANASRKNHAELDGQPELDTGDPVDLADRYRSLLQRFPHINVIGGCCGTDHRHIEQISRTCQLAA